VRFIITTNTHEKVILIKQEIKNISTKLNKLYVADVRLVFNRGRDIGPFMMIMKEVLTDFDIVGHFHLKGTKQLSIRAVQQWQDFLYDTLIGNHGEIAEQLLDTFQVNSKLGLVFQEDPCLPSWGKNLNLVVDVLSKLGLKVKLDNPIEYPTGNMFWMRKDALLPLFKYDWQWSDFPEEPVPYDGTILHAIERISPLICEAAGFEWKTVYNPEALRYYS
jgi:lipopolysaccharide biosynthesis protein